MSELITTRVKDAAHRLHLTNLVDSLDGLVERRDGRAVLTVRGRLLANAVTAHLEIGTAGPEREPAGAPGPPTRAGVAVPTCTIPPYFRS